MSDANTKVFIIPQYKGEDKADGGIRRVIEAMYKYLPQFGIDIVDDPAAADVINCHGTMMVEAFGKPIVTSCHGLYWDDYNWPKWAHAANSQVTEALISASAITSPSEWVSKAITRALLKRPHTIYHGVDVDDWEHSLENYGYVLWNKARLDAVSDPSVILTLARLLPHIKFVVTAMWEDVDLPENVRVAGVRPYEESKELVQRAGVYLVTTRETFGIGTLEALAAGVPVVGWNYGGQSEIVEQGKTGYLADFGDVDSLAAAISRAIEYREELSSNCRADARARWGWEHRIFEYASVFRGEHAKHARTAALSGPKVSVLVTNYNLGKYLADALDSVVAQDMSDWECIIVDDASTDDSYSVVVPYMQNDSRFKYVRNPENMGLSRSRNIAFAASYGKYVIPLDADDQLTPNALRLLSDHLDGVPSTHIAYGHLAILGRHERASWPPESFNWHQQLAHNNQLPYSAMMRREVLTRTGGYRLRDWRAEDASLWCRATSHGMRAVKAVNSPTLTYRFRNDGKSASENSQFADRDGDWTWFTPWARAKKYTPWAAQGKPEKGFWRVQHLQNIKVTVIIPVGDGHEKFLPDALDSLLAQTEKRWDVIIVDDTSSQKIYPDALGAPYATLISTGGKKGPGYSRNLGAELVKHSTKTEFLLFLDADDYLTPEALTLLLKASETSTASFIYPDGFHETGGQTTYAETPNYTQRFWEMDSHIPVTSLMRRSAFEQVKGFDEKLKGWEDLDLYIRLGAEGLCGSRLAANLLVYRLDTGTRRKNTVKEKASISKSLNTKYSKYITGGEDMCGCKGGGGTINGPALARKIGDTFDDEEDSLLGGAPTVEITATTVLEFTGRGSGVRPFKGFEGRVYWGADSASNRRAEVHNRDVDKLLATQQWRLPPRVDVGDGEDDAFATPPPPITERPSA